MSKRSSYSCRSLSTISMVLKVCIAAVLEKTGRGYDWWWAGRGVTEIVVKENSRFDRVTVTIQVTVSIGVSVCTQSWKTERVTVTIAIAMRESRSQSRSRKFVTFRKHQDNWLTPSPQNNKNYAFFVCLCLECFVCKQKKRPKRFVKRFCFFKTKIPQKRFCKCFCLYNTQIFKVAFFFKANK